jgi:hypothetical protein
MRRPGNSAAHAFASTPDGLVVLGMGAQRQVIGLVVLFRERDPLVRHLAVPAWFEVTVMDVALDEFPDHLFVEELIAL